MLVQPTQKEGTSSERLSEAQPTPSPEPTSEAPNESLHDHLLLNQCGTILSKQPDFHQVLHPGPSPKNPSPNPSPTPNNSLIHSRTYWFQIKPRKLKTLEG
ncbi:hypothetical protein Tco_0565040 [Tanacetum coccineum]